MAMASGDGLFRAREGFWSGLGLAVGVGVGVGDGDADTDAEGDGDGDDRGLGEADGVGLVGVAVRVGFDDGAALAPEVHAVFPGFSAHSPTPDTRT
jgi:hypothetical protein